MKNVRFLFVIFELVLISFVTAIPIAMYNSTTTETATTTNPGISLPPSVSVYLGSIDSGVPVTRYMEASWSVIYSIRVDNESLGIRVVLECGANDYDSELWRRINGDSESHPISTPGGENYTLENPAAGTWYVHVYAITGSGPFTLTVTVTYPNSSTSTSVTTDTLPESSADLLLIGLFLTGFGVVILIVLIITVARQR